MRRSGSVIVLAGATVAALVICCRPGRRSSEVPRGPSNVATRIGDPTPVVRGNGWVLEGLGTLGGGSSEALGINDAGQVVGKAMNERGVERGVLFDRSGATDLNGADGLELVVGRSINRRGQVVGMATAPGHGPRAILFQRGVAVDLGTLGGDQSEAFGINDAGEVVGRSTRSREGEQQEHAFLHVRGQLLDLGTLGAPTAPRSTSTTRARSSAKRRPSAVPPTPSFSGTIGCATSGRWEGRRARRVP